MTCVFSQRIPRHTWRRPDFLNHRSSDRGRIFGSAYLKHFFWLYCIIYSVAAETALYFLANATQASITQLPEPVLILIAITGTNTVLQSLTFKVGRKKVLDLSRYLDDYRRKVLAPQQVW